MTEWWTAQAGTLMGAFGGAGIGVVGGLYGTLVGILAPRGKGKGVVMAAHYTLMGLGVGCLIFGIAALATSQPYHVYYPLLLIGLILSVVLGGLLPVVRSRYRQAEQRRMDAQILRKS